MFPSDFYMDNLITGMDEVALTLTKSPRTHRPLSIHKIPSATTIITKIFQTDEYAEDIEKITS